MRWIPLNGIIIGCLIFCLSCELWWGDYQNLRFDIDLVEGNYVGSLWYYNEQDSLVEELSISDNFSTTVSRIGNILFTMSCDSIKYSIQEIEFELHPKGTSYEEIILSPNQAYELDTNANIYGNNRFTATTSPEGNLVFYHLTLVSTDPDSIYHLSLSAVKSE